MREKLIQLREEKGLTQAEVASFLGLSRQAYTMYESGQRTPKASTVKKLCELFEVPSDYLIGVESSIPDNANAVRIPVYGVVPAFVPTSAKKIIMHKIHRRFICRSCRAIMPSWTKYGMLSGAFCSSMLYPPLLLF